MGRGDGGNRGDQGEGVLRTGGCGQGGRCVDFRGGWQKGSMGPRS